MFFRVYKAVFALNALLAATSASFGMIVATRAVSPNMALLVAAVAVASVAQHLSEASHGLGGAEVQADASLKKSPRFPKLSQILNCEKDNSAFKLNPPLDCS